jgi:hypothetical protein
LVPGRKRHKSPRGRRITTSTAPPVTAPRARATARSAKHYENVQPISRNWPRKNQFPAETVAQLIDGRTSDEAHRKGDMPLWGDVFSKSQTNAGPEDVKARIDALVKHLETIQDKSEH